MTLAIGTKIESCGCAWTVVSVGRVYYHLETQGKKTGVPCTTPILKGEAHADIASGIAKVVA